MKKIYVRLQEPTIELVVKGVDGSGKTAKTTVGFRRYDLDGSSEKLKELDQIRQDIRDKSEGETDSSKIDASELDKFIQDNVLYFLNESLITEDEQGRLGKLGIKDTRTVKPIEGFWETPEECKTFILEGYLNSAAWRFSFSESLTRALMNTEILSEETDEKN